MKQPIVVHIPLVGVHGSLHPSFKIVALDAYCAHVLGHAHGVVATMRRTPCVENFIDLEVETSRLSEYHP